MLQEIAGMDMSDNILVKEKIDTCMDGLLNQNKQLKIMMESAAEKSNTIVQNISAAVVDMEFHTQNTAIVDTITARLTAHSGTLNRLANEVTSYMPLFIAPPEALEQRVQGIAEGIKLGDIKQRYAEKLQQRGIAALFLSPQSAVVEEDDIELF